MRITSFLIVFMLTFFCGCDDSETSIELRKNIKKLKLKIKSVEQETKNLEIELQDTWISSLFYRFPGIKNIDLGKEIHNDFVKLKYLTKINFLSYYKQKLKLIFNYKTDNKKVQPHFYIYIFDAKGINIYKEKIRYKKLFSPYLKIGKLIPHKKTLKLPKNSSTPTYFLLKEVTQ